MLKFIFAMITQNTSPFPEMQILAFCDLMMGKRHLEQATTILPPETGIQICAAAVARILPLLYQARLR